jgi:hypothetical protein
MAKAADVMRACRSFTRTISTLFSVEYRTLSNSATSGGVKSDTEVSFRQ